MKKSLYGLLLVLGTMLVGSMTVSAETIKGSDDWKVSFTKDKEMVSNFKTSALDETISGLQPGDDVEFTLYLVNEYPTTVDWYMTNKVLYSLEDRSTNAATAGGAYTYILTYTDKAGKVTTLFSSDTVGGEDISAAGEGLHEATNALMDYFYLDTLVQGQNGVIKLIVALDGETQGNDYQDTLADLQMNFAVELGPDNPPEDTPPGDNPPEDTPPDTPPTPPTIVKTGDDLNLVPFFIVASVSGILLLVVAIYGISERRKQNKGGES